MSSYSAQWKSPNLKLTCAKTTEPKEDSADNKDVEMLCVSDVPTLDATVAKLKV